MVETRRIRTGVREVNVDLYGRGGPWVVLLHGAPGYRKTFQAVAEDLAHEHRVAVPDLLGFGASDPAPRGTHAEAQAEMVLDLLDALGAPEAHLAGFGYGGTAALLTLRRGRERVLSLTLAATHAFLDARLPGPLRVARLPIVGDVVLRLGAGRAGLLAMWRFATGDKKAFPLWRFAKYLRFRQGVTSTRHVFKESLRHLERRFRDVQETLSVVDVPCTVLWGDRDPLLSAATGERTARAAGARLVLLEGCGHFIPEERPHAMADEIRKLSRQVIMREVATASPPPPPP